ncbi:hypothetical protein D3C78_669150 [compost metagenome]
MVTIDLRALGDLGDLLFHSRRQPSDQLQLPASPLDLPDALIEIAGQLADLFDYFTGPLLDVLDHLADLFGGIRRAPSQAAHLFRHHGEPAAMLAGARRFDGRVERQQIGLIGNRLDDMGDALDLLAALVERLDQLATGAGPGTELMHASDGRLQLATTGIAAGARLGRGFHGLSRQVGSGPLGVDHHLGATDDLPRRQQLRLQALHQLLHRIGNACSGKRVVADALRQVTGQLGNIRQFPGRARRGAATGDAPGQPEQRKRQQQAQRERPAA